MQGNLATKGPPGSPQAYQFDVGNRLRSVPGKKISYEYDGLGRWVYAMTVGSGQILSQYANSGQLLYQENHKQSKRIDYVYLGSSLVAFRERPLAMETATLKYQHTDALSSPIAVTDAAKAIIDTSEYEPYGQVVNAALKDGPGYTGHVLDAATGLNYMQQRYMDPQLGVFLSVDPITTYSNPVGQFHRYRYANNSPYRFTDPDGRKSDDDVKQKVTGSNIAGGGSANNVSVIQMNPPNGGVGAQTAPSNANSNPGSSQQLNATTVSSTPTGAQGTNELVREWSLSQPSSKVGR